MAPSSAPHPARITARRIRRGPARMALRPSHYQQRGIHGQAARRVAARHRAGAVSGHVLGAALCWSESTTGVRQRVGAPEARGAADAVQGPEGRAGVPRRRHVGDSEAPGARNAPHVSFRDTKRSTGLLLWQCGGMIHLGQCLLDRFRKCARIGHEWGKCQGLLEIVLFNRSNRILARPLRIVSPESQPHFEGSIHPIISTLSGRGVNTLNGSFSKAESAGRLLFSYRLIITSRSRNAWNFRGID